MTLLEVETETRLDYTGVCACGRPGCVSDSVFSLAGAARGTLMTRPYSVTR